jgi:hypothetical protein
VDRQTVDDSKTNRQFCPDSKGNSRGVGNQLASQFRANLVEDSQLDNRPSNQVAVVSRVKVNRAEDNPPANQLNNRAVEVNRGKVVNSPEEVNRQEDNPDKAEISAETNAVDSRASKAANSHAVVNRLEDNQPAVIDDLGKKILVPLRRPCKFMFTMAMQPSSAAQVEAQEISGRA